MEWGLGDVDALKDCLRNADTLEEGYPSPGPVTFPIRSQEPDLEAGGALHRAALDGIRLSEVLCYTLDHTVVLLRL